ncbi:autophagy 5 [Chlorella sorokiniana]|uniref:Autophagy 5 n=1 Tax=Chlorella sorokiniana TaxID=3076 RepID=A0A2P6TW20_CHLSO|nr:autophagy 5 [Chlorella sorokiniana]|eukprot:PRW58258.1 autophagy 5 [Chlorella sorokiniana]
MAGGTRAVAGECWAAAIPVQLRLAESEVSSLEQPPTLYALVPRQSYLHSLVPAALRALQHLLPPGEDAPWFEHGRLPLKWNVPAGVLYDLVAAPSGELPWRLTIHFRGFPSKMLPAYGGEGALRGAFFSSLKEAAVVCRGSAQRVMEMAAGAQEDLFRQALDSSLDRYQAILASLQLAPAAQRGASPRLPLRLYLRTDAGGYLSSYEDIVSTSRPVAALTRDGSPTSLRQALLPLVEEFLRHRSSGGGGSSSLAASAAAPPSPMAGSVAGGVQSLPGTPVARSSSIAEDAPSVARSREWAACRKTQAAGPPPPLAAAAAAAALGGPHRTPCACVQLTAARLGSQRLPLRRRRGGLAVTEAQSPSAPGGGDGLDGPAWRAFVLELQVLGTASEEAFEAMLQEHRQFTIATQHDTQVQLLRLVLLFQTDALRHQRELAAANARAAKAAAAAKLAAAAADERAAEAAAATKVAAADARAAEAAVRAAEAAAAAKVADFKQAAATRELRAARKLLKQQDARIAQLEAQAPGAQD